MKRNHRRKITKRTHCREAETKARAESREIIGPTWQRVMRLDAERADGSAAATPTILGPLRASLAVTKILQGGPPASAGGGTRLPVRGRPRTVDNSDAAYCQCEVRKHRSCGP